MTRTSRTTFPLVAGLMAIVLAVGAWLVLGGGDEAEGDEGVAVIGTAGDGVPAARPAVEARETPEALAPDQAATAPREPEAPPMPDSYRHALGGLTGRVVEEDGTPVPGVLVEAAGADVVAILESLTLADSLAGPPPALDVVLGSDTTAEDGTFVIRDLEPATLGVLLVDARGPRNHLRPIEQTPVSGETLDVGDIVLPGTVTFSGLVLDDDGRPVEGARVRATDLSSVVVGLGLQDYRPGSAILVLEGPEDPLVFVPPGILTRLEERLPIPTTTTGPDGRFELAGIPTGLITTVVDDGTHVALVHGPVPSGPPGGERDLGTLTVLDGVTVRGRVENDDGDPVADAEVRAGNELAMAPIALLNRETTSDERGRFEVPGLRPGRVRAVARRDAVSEFGVSDAETAGAREVVVRLPPRRELRLVVYALPDGEGGERVPVDELRVGGRAVVDDEIPDFVQPPWPWAERVRPDPDDPLAMTVEGLEPATYQVVLEAPGFSQVRETVDLTEADGVLEVKMPVGLELDVRVVRASDGEPLEYAIVSAGRDADLPHDSARTDARGLASLRDVPAGEALRLVASYPGLAIGSRLVEPPIPTDEPVRLELDAGGSIRGQVLLEDGSTPLVPVLVMLIAEPTNEEATGMPLRFTLTDLEGRFGFDHVQPGEAELQARERSVGSGTIGPFEMFIATPLAEAEVEVPVDGTVDALLVAGSAFADVETGTLRGQLVVDGRTEAGWTLRTWGKIRRSAKTDAEGRFELGRVAAGEVEVQISAPGRAYTDSRVHEHEVDVAPDVETYETIVLTTGSIQGRVVTEPGGFPIGGVAVTAQRAGELSEEEEEEEEEAAGALARGRGRATALTDARGTFSLGPLAEGRYRVRVEGTHEHAGAAVDQVRVTGRGPTLGVTLRMVEAINVSGRVVFTGTDETPRFMWLQAEREDGEGREWTRVDAEDGTYSFEGLAPGAWSFTLASDLDTRFEPLELELHTSAAATELVFEVRPDEPEAEAVEEVEEK